MSFLWSTIRRKEIGVNSFIPRTRCMRVKHTLVSNLYDLVSPLSVKMSTTYYLKNTCHIQEGGGVKVLPKGLCPVEL